MKASAHTEVYRPFKGHVRTRRWRFVPLLSAGIKTALKKRLPLLLLFAPLAIGTVIFAFVVYSSFAIQAGAPPSALGQPGGLPGLIGSALLAGRAEQLIKAREMIVTFHLATNIFSMLLIAWYGAGLLAEDRRLGAHLLYFARPLSRLDYLTAKFLTVAFFGALGSILPGLIICVIATFASPEWSFIRSEYDVVLATFGFGLLWTVLGSSIVLCASSLSSRRIFALIGVFAAFMLVTATGNILGFLQRDPDFRALSPFMAADRIAVFLFDLKRRRAGMDLDLAWISVTSAILLSWAVTWWRVKRMDVVS
ncbi:MAG: ABC-2 transporter permease [Planctomycetes bacterium]|nr:ABC-2 transporter permease [Planctomycetota bacterium]